MGLFEKLFSPPEPMIRDAPKKTWHVGDNNLGKSNATEDVEKAATTVVERPNPGSTPTRRRVQSIFPQWFQRTDYTLENSELVFSAVSRIANAFSAMPVQLYEGSTPIKNRLNDTLRNAPNSCMTSSQFFRTLEACRCTSGNCYAIKALSPSGSLERLEIVNPDRIAPVVERSSGELWYRVQPENGNEYYLHSYYVLHIPFISTNGISGVNPVRVLTSTLDYSSSIHKFSVDLLTKGINAPIVLQAPAQLGKAQKKATIDAFMDTYRETSGNILLLESGVIANTLDLSPVDSKLFEVEKITRSKVAMVYNLPPHLLGDYSDTSFTSQEQQMLEFLMLTMLPTVTAYEQELNRKLLTSAQRMRGLHWRFDMNAILRADAATQAEVNYKAVRSAWKTPDEIRAEYYSPPLPNNIGQDALTSRDLVPLRMLPDIKTATSGGKEKDT